jgi:hypothetical protein
MDTLTTSVGQVGAIRQRAVFAHRGLAARNGGGLSSEHRMHPAARERYEALLAMQAVAYTVYSYQTPIGWVSTDGTAEVPEIFYSRTTTRHQNLARRALDLLCTVRARRE